MDKLSIELDQVKLGLKDHGTWATRTIRTPPGPFSAFDTVKNILKFQKKSLEAARALEQWRAAPQVGAQKCGTLSGGASRIAISNIYLNRSLTTAILEPVPLIDKTRLRPVFTVSIT